MYMDLKVIGVDKRYELALLHKQILTLGSFFQKFCLLHRKENALYYRTAFHPSPPPPLNISDDAQICDNFLLMPFMFMI